MRTKTSIVAAIVASIPFTHAFADKATVEASYGAWSVFLATDQMNDRSWYGATLQSDPGGASLQVDCTAYLPNRLNVGFRMKEYIGGEFTDLTYRVDKNPAHRITASVHEKSASLLCEGACKGDGEAPSPDIQFIAEARGGNTLLVRVKDFWYNDIDVAFQLDRANEAFDHILRGCARLHSETPEPNPPKKKYYN